MFPVLLAQAPPDASTAPSAKPQYLTISKEHPTDSRGDVVYGLESKLPEGVEPLHGTMAPPRLLWQKQPKFPKSLRKRKAGGVVTVEGIITPQGDIIDLAVYKTQVPPEAVAEASENSLKAVQSYVFAPATIDGRPVATFVRVEVKYQIY